MNNALTQWQYYNHAIIPATPPHVTPDLTPVYNGTIWKLGGVKRS